MKKKTQQLAPLKLTNEEKARLPLGYSEIFTSKISPRKIEDKVLVYSKKYKKGDLFALVSEKPISKILN